MTASFAIHESNEVGETTSVATDVNFGSSDTPNLTTASYPIDVGDNSYEKWERFQFTGSFNKIENLKVWKSAGNYQTDEVINTNGTTSGYSQASFATPTASGSSEATIAIPTSEPAGANMGIAGALSGSLTAVGYSDYWVLQTTSSASTEAGDGNQKTFTIKYQES